MKRSHPHHPPRSCRHCGKRSPEPSLETRRRCRYCSKEMARQCIYEHQRWHCPFFCFCLLKLLPVPHSAAPQGCSWMTIITNPMCENQAKPVQQKVNKRSKAHVQGRTTHNHENKEHIQNHATASEQAMEKNLSEACVHYPTARADAIYAWRGYPPQLVRERAHARNPS